MELSRPQFTYEYVSNSIEKGVIEDINAVYPVLSGLTLLQIATFNNDTKLVDYLLRKGADINAKTQCWGSVFNIDAVVKNLTTIQCLKSLGADVSDIIHQTEFSELNRFMMTVDQYYEEIPASLLPSFTSLSTIVLSGDLGFVTLPLNIAINRKNVEMVELLLKNNADTNPDADSYGAPLVIAALKGNLAIMKLLLEYGADVNIVKKYLGESPLHIAVKEGNSEAVELFLNHDMIDINMVTQDKDSALHYGLYFMFDDRIIRQLLNAGIDINLKNSKGTTAFMSNRHYSKEINDAITEHLAKCSAANFYVNEENLALVDRKKIGELRKQCMSEIEKMKVTFIGTSNVTFHYVLYNKCVHKLALSLKYVSDRTILYLDINSIFPLYGGMMTYRLKKALRRKKLLFNAIELTDDTFQELQLPSTFTRDIFKFLTNEDLKKLQ